MKRLKKGITIHYPAIRLESSPEELAEDLSESSAILPKPPPIRSMSPTYLRLMTPWVRDDFEKGVGLFDIPSPEPAGGINLPRQDRIFIEKNGRVVEINPANHELYLTNYGRRIYGGVIDQWNDLHIKKLLFRYLGDLSDVEVNSFLQKLGLVGTTEPEDEAKFTIFPIG